MWHPRFRTDIDLLENVQHRATRMINGLKKVPYEERLRLMDLPTMSYRRLRGDAIEAYKCVHGKYSVDWSSLQPLADETSTLVTRGHTFKRCFRFRLWRSCFCDCECTFSAF